MSDYRPETTIPVMQPGSCRIAIATASWNSHITHALRDGAIKILRQSGLSENDIECHDVPGAVELTYAAARLSARADAVIVFGCVIKGDTPHFDYVCQSVTQGITGLNMTGKKPIIFGVLTVNDEQQALDRVGGPHGHKGEEAAAAALQMLVFDR